MEYSFERSLVRASSSKKTLRFSIKDLNYWDVDGGEYVLVSFDGTDVVTPCRYSNGKLTIPYQVTDYLALEKGETVSFTVLDLPDKEAFICEDCGKEYDTYQAYNRHYGMKHKEPRRRSTGSDPPLQGEYDPE